VQAPWASPQASKLGQGGMQCWLQWLHPWLLLPAAHQV